jgi:hypothetical protein
MKKVVNLADRKAAYELLKKLYENDEVTDDFETRCTARERGTTMVGGLVELSSCSKRVFSQDE